MAVGDDALAAGMTLVSGTGKASDIDLFINGALDEIARRTRDVMPLERGGTGSTTAAAARSALGITSSVIPSGGGNVQGDLNYLADEVSKRALTTHGHNALADGANYLRWDGSQWVSNAPVGFTNRLNVGAYFLGAGDGEIRGNFFLPNASAATASWQVAYINGDGRVCRGSSSARYKKNIADFEPLALGDIFPAFQRYKMRADGITPSEEKWRYGYIAEQLAENPDQAPFVVYRDVDDSGTEVPDSIDFIGLLIAQTAQLHAGLDLALQRIEQLEAEIHRG